MSDKSGFESDLFGVLDDLFGYLAGYLPKECFPMRGLILSSLWRAPKLRALASDTVIYLKEEKHS